MKKLTFQYIILCLATHISFGQLKEVTYQDGEQKLNGLVSKPKKPLKNLPGILLLPAWKGIDTSSKNIAKSLSDNGYTVFIADIYGEGNYPKDNAEAGKIAGQYKTDFKAYQHRIQKGIDELVKSGANPDQIVVIGYCFGGTGAIEAARGHLNVKGIVSFHGGLKKDASRPNESITTKVLICHGADDKSVTEDDIHNFEKEMREGKADWQFISYGNAVHSFTNPEAGNDNSKGNAYNEAAAKRSFTHLLQFLKEVLP